MRARLEKRAAERRALGYQQIDSILTMYEREAAAIKAREAAQASASLPQPAAAEQSRATSNDRPSEPAG